ncbi:MAG: hypothetical protein ACYS7Y_03980 [Planctomycetota bacterium]|jgi:hypothetical protein
MSPVETFVAATVIITALVMSASCGPLMLAYIWFYTLKAIGVL